MKGFAVGYFTRSNVHNQFFVHAEVVSDRLDRLYGANIFFTLFPMTAVGRIKSKDLPNILIDDSDSPKLMIEHATAKLK
jgi:hypothetical protein